MDAETFEISGSHCGEYEDEGLLRYSSVQSRSRPTFQRCVPPHNHLDDGGSTHLSNVDLLQQDYTALYPRRLSSSDVEAVQLLGNRCIKSQGLRQLCNTRKTFNFKYRQLLLTDPQSLNRRKLNWLQLLTDVLFNIIRRSTCRPSYVLWIS
jgi:hypothetical protein